VIFGWIEFDFSVVVLEFVPTILTFAQEVLNYIVHEIFAGYTRTQNPIY